MDPTDPNAVPEPVAYSSPPPSRRSNERIIEDDQDNKVTAFYVIIFTPSNSTYNFKPLSSPTDP